MNLVYLVSGGLILAIASIDILWTILWVEGGAGPLTSRVMNLLWQLIRQTVGTRRRLLTLSGPVILLASLTLWLVLLWGGWTLVFAAGDPAIEDTRNAGPISWWELLYFTGYSMFTLGNGDFTPQGSIWQMATVLATATGMLFVTLMITYVLSVLGAVTQKRSFASSVSSLGTESVEILRTSWSGEEFQGLDIPLNTVTSELNTLTANHKAYPILHYFYSAKPVHAPAVSIVVLDDLLTVLRFGVPAQHRPPDVIVGNARSSVQDYLETLHEAFIDPADRSPPIPDLDALQGTGIPTVTDEAFTDSLGDIEKRRRQLLGLIESDLRKWPTGDGE